VNGSQENSAAGGAIDVVSPQGVMHIGEAYGEPFDGLMNDVRLYTKALTTSEIRRAMLDYHRPVDPGNLVGWWRFEEGRGTTGEDSSGEGNDGTLNPAADPPVWERVEKWELRSEVGL